MESYSTKDLLNQLRIELEHEQWIKFCKLEPYDQFDFLTAHKEFLELLIRKRRQKKKTILILCISVIIALMYKKYFVN